MSEKRPQSTSVLVKRLRRVAKYHDAIFADMKHPADAARANTCWQAAARLEEADEELSAMPEIMIGDGV